MLFQPLAATVTQSGFVAAGFGDPGKGQESWFFKARRGKGISV
jgi:hypothetical protein